MENSLYVALSRQVTIRRMMEVMAHNVANATTPGFKGESMMFAEYVKKTPRAEPLSFVQDRAMMRDMREGGLQRTDNPLDLAIAGNGWFTVENAQGRFYTRNGHFKIDPQGQIATSQGDVVLGDNGAPIRLQPEDTEITILGDGSVTVRGEARGRLLISAFDNDQTLRKASGSLYRSENEGRPATGAAVIQGAVEHSNIEAVVEMTRMMEAMRTYQHAQKMVDVEHERQRRAIDRLTKTN